MMLTQQPTTPDLQRKIPSKSAWQRYTKHVTSGGCVEICASKSYGFTERSTFVGMESINWITTSSAVSISQKKHVPKWFLTGSPKLKANDSGKKHLLPKHWIYSKVTLHLKHAKKSEQTYRLPFQVLWCLSNVTLRSFTSHPFLSRPRTGHHS